MQQSFRFQASTRTHIPGGPTAVDLFAGLGGCSQGATEAGVNVIWAANHWNIAVATHAANHPYADHVCQDLHHYPYHEIPDHQILLASPSCKGHSPARGKSRPIDDMYRATAWIVIEVLEAKKPQFAVVENVVEMQQWRLFPQWLDAIHALGYSTNLVIWDAADSGVPQERVRLFVIISRTRNPMSIKLERLPRVPVSSVLRWDEGKWSPIYKRGRAQATLSRIERAIKQGYGPRFIMPYYGRGSGLTGRSLNRPIGTLTTRARWALVDLDRGVMRMLSVEEARACMGFPETYKLPVSVADANMALGNAVCPPVMRQILEKILEA